MTRRLYTPELANRSLPLVARIAADVQAHARRIQATWLQLQGGGDAGLQQQLEQLRDAYNRLVDELEQLGIELKDPLSGLLDFRARRRGEEVYLCWRLGESSVANWHALDAGFAGRRPIAEF